MLLLAAGLCRTRSDSTPASRPAGSEISGGSAAADTLRGIIGVVGAEPAVEVILAKRGSAAPVTLTGDTRLLRLVSGTEVWVHGKPSASNSFEVTRFEVRSVDGMPALDGVLALDAGRLVLVTPDRLRHPIAHPPAALRDALGARVWIAGPLSAEPAAFGVIRRE